MAALVSTRVYGGELPKGDVALMPRATVVVKRAGGGVIGTAYQDYSDVRVDVIGYGANLLQADQVFLTVHDALKHMRSAVYASTLLHWARLSAGAFTGRDPDTDWATCLSSWQVLASEVAAA